MKETTMLNLQLTYNAEIGHYNTLIAHIKYIIIDVD